MNNIIMKLKDIRDELEQPFPLATADSYEKAMELNDIAEQIALAKYHLQYAINKLSIYQCFEEKEESEK